MLIKVGEENNKSLYGLASKKDSSDVDGMINFEDVKVRPFNSGDVDEDRNYPD